MAFGGGLEEDNEVMSEINMTPLVDVMLVLLIIFIITVPVLTHSVKVDLPRADNSLNDIKPETVNLAVTAQGQRSEEHTSELQSRPHLVCRLLLEKKKKKKYYNTI